jgi:predicted acetyltransferase
MRLELRELALNDGEDVREMLREIGPGEAGFAFSASSAEPSEFPRFLKRQNDMAHAVGIDLNILVPQTTYWLYAGDRPVGIGRLRHYLNDYLRIHGGHIGYMIRQSERKRGYGCALLAQLLLKAHEKGIEDAFLTCNDDNTGSRKIIEHNGGELESIVDGECRYWIKAHFQATIPRKSS